MPGEVIGGVGLAGLLLAAMAEGFTGVPTVPGVALVVEDDWKGLLLQPAKTTPTRTTDKHPAALIRMASVPCEKIQEETAHCIL